MIFTFANLKPEVILLSLILKWIYNTYVWKRCHWLRIWAENVENIRLSSQHRSFFNLKILSIDLKNISKCVKEILFNEELEIMWCILSCGSVDTYWQQEATPFSIRTVHLLPKFESQTLKNPETRAMQLLGDWRSEELRSLLNCFEASKVSESLMFEAVHKHGIKNLLILPQSIRNLRKKWAFYLSRYIHT